MGSGVPAHWIGVGLAPKILSGHGHHAKFSSISYNSCNVKINLGTTGPYTLIKLHGFELE